MTHQADRSDKEKLLNPDEAENQTNLKGDWDLFEVLPPDDNDTYVDHVSLLLDKMHIFGLLLLVVTLFSQLDASNALMITGATYGVPRILGMISWEISSVFHKSSSLVTYVVIIICQLFYLLVIWNLLDPYTSLEKLWLFFLSAVVVFCGWWENYLYPPSEYLVNMMNVRVWKYRAIRAWKMAAGWKDGRQRRRRGRRAFVRRNFGRPVPFRRGWISWKV